MPDDTTDADDDMYCERHDLKRPAYENTDDPHCPYCREERRIEEMRAERAQRHPPRSVDDPAPTSSYNAW